jgi:hypothetical protein
MITEIGDLLVRIASQPELTTEERAEQSSIIMNLEAIRRRLRALDERIAARGAESPLDLVERRGRRDTP